jgi:hypothetical protein
MKKSAQVVIGPIGKNCFFFWLLIGLYGDAWHDGGGIFRGHEKTEQGGINVSIRDEAESL